MVAGLLAPVYDPEPTPDQEMKVEPLFGSALTVTLDPAAMYDNPDGLVDPAPDGLACIVRGYCC
jgi:hypothetical protein